MNFKTPDLTPLFILAAIGGAAVSALVLWLIYHLIVAVGQYIPWG